MSKQVVAVLFGGQSSEHDVSKVSAATIISNINTEKYSVIPVYITKEGKWLLYDGPLDSIGNNDWQKFASTCILSPDTEHHGLLRIVGDKVKNIPVDELRDHLSEIEKDKPVYVICQSGLRSYIATRILSQNGYDAYNFAGGFRFYEAVMHDRSLVEKETACGMDL
mgnify:CR=1 FL=1